MVSTDAFQATRFPEAVLRDSAVRTASPNQLKSDTASLTRGLASGNEAAFGLFHRLYFDRLLRYLLVVTHGNEQAARDALQETFLRVVRHARGFQDQEAFWCWLRVLAQSAARDIGRRQRSYWRLLAKYARCWLPPGLEDPSDQETQDQLLRLLEQSLANLPAPDRTLIEGKYLQQAAITELANETHLTERAVESRLRRARRRLKELLLRNLNHEA